MPIGVYKRTNKMNIQKSKDCKGHTGIYKRKKIDLLKRSKWMTGKGNHNFGKRFPKSVCKKLRDSHTGIIRSKDSIKLQIKSHKKHNAVVRYLSLAFKQNDFKAVTTLDIQPDLIVRKGNKLIAIEVEVKDINGKLDKYDKIDIFDEIRFFNKQKELVKRVIK